MRILALDISSHTGWAILEDDKIISYGKIDISCEDSSWPLGVLNWAKQVTIHIFELIEKEKFDRVIVERANSSRFRNSQNFLDFTHCLLINKLVDAGHYSKLLYIDSSHWRKICVIKLTNEQKKQNRLAKQASNSGKILKIDGKRKGKVTKKHLAVNWVNEKYNLEFRLKDNDIAEAICLGSSFFIEQQ